LYCPDFDNGMKTISSGSTSVASRVALPGL